LLSDFDWQQNPAALLAKFAEQLLGEILHDSRERTAWIRQAASRGEIVFLLDSLDQTRRNKKSDPEVQFASFLRSDTGRKCPVLVTMCRKQRRQKKKAGAALTGGLSGWIHLTSLASESSGMMHHCLTWYSKMPIGSH
jgi:hypothetical protein